jgi:hypothetical protein
MAQVTAQAALAAQAVLACSVLAERITISPGNVSPGGLDTYGPVVLDPYAEVPGIISGIYDT